MNSQAQLLINLLGYLSEPQLDTIKRAIQIAIKSHGSQFRKSGEPYYYHPIAVAIITAEIRLDCSSIITALLHDTVEDTDLTLLDIQQEFGDEVSKLVDGVTKLTKIEHQSEHTRQAENFRKLLLAMSDDIRVLLVKLADRLHNMRTLKFIDSEAKRIKIAHETMEIYAPLAERIGIQTLKSELQDLAFAELYPKARSSIINRLEYLRAEGITLIDKVIKHINNTLKQANIDALVKGREKTPYSIWQKMERKNISFEQLSDIMAFRIIVDSVAYCYQVLGVIHSKYHMVFENFKDFISTPKANNYQSIHTVVIGPEQQKIEIQIRTKDMHQVAEFGVAAHWRYKQNQEYNTEGKQYRWLRELLDILENANDPDEFLENTKLEMYYDQVFCFTPKGRLIALPRGATPIDFAYAVHSDIGYSCAGAKINGRIVPLRIELKNGDQVEIIRSKLQVPSIAWEKFVVTGKARAEIKKYIRAQQKQEYTHLGRAILAKSFRNQGHELNEKMLENILEHFKKKSTEELLLAVGEGNINRNEVIKSLYPELKIKTSFKEKLSFFNFKKKLINNKRSPMPIKGLIEGVAVHLAHCCHPLPGDSIVGIIHTGKGVNIHIADCKNLQEFTFTPEVWLEVAWENDNYEVHIGRIKAVISHEYGSLADLTSAIAKEKSNIANLKIINRTNEFFEIVFDLEVKGATHLTNIINSIKSRNYIHLVERIKK